MDVIFTRLDSLITKKSKNKKIYREVSTTHNGYVIELLILIGDEIRIKKREGVI